MSCANCKHFNKRNIVDSGLKTPDGKHTWFYWDGACSAKNTLHPTPAEWMSCHLFVKEGKS